MSAPAPAVVAARCSNAPTGPCNWPIDMGCCATLDLSKVDPAVLDRRLQLAAELIWMYSGRRFGLCDVTVRPCNRRCAPPRSAPGPEPAIIGGQWFNIGCGCGTFSDCSCGPLSQVCLPGPARSVDYVAINGQLLEPDQYRIDDFRYLTRTDGGQWPPCQHMDAGPADEGAFVVAYQRGEPVPVGGQYAAGVLACELLKDCLGDKSCRLPRNIASLDRQGVRIDFVQRTIAQNHYRTGIAEVDLWLTAVNPKELASAADVWTPDACDRNRRTTWSGV